MSSAYLHPEFGYFCPSPGLRRTVRIALVSTIIGVIAGASGVAALIAAHDPAPDTLASVRTDPRNTGNEPDVSQSSVVKADAISMPRAEPGMIRSDAVKSVAKSDGIKSDVAKIETATPDAGKLATARTDVAAGTCEANTWAYLDGKCASGTVPKMRIVRTGTATGRNSSGNAGAGAPVAPAANEPAGRNDGPSSIPRKSTQATAAVVAPQPPVVAHKKPQTAASKPIHRRDQAARNAPPLREVRAQPAEPPAYAPFGGGGFLPMFR